MNDHRSDSALTDAALDREIEIALAVDPSPDFEARVRMRVASEPVPAPFWLSWKFMTAGATVAAIVVAAVVLRPHEKTVVAPVPQTAASRAAQAAEPVAQTVSPVAQASRPANAWPKSHATIVGRPGNVTGAEILLDPAETRALRRLIAGARDGRIDLEPVLRASTPTAMDLPPIGVIDIPSITIDPIAPGAGEEGVWQ